MPCCFANTNRSHAVNYNFHCTSHKATNRDGKECKPRQNEEKQNPGFAKNQTEPKPKCRGSYSVLSLNKIVGTFTHFTVNEVFYFT